MSDLRGDRKTLDVWREPVHGLQVVVESWRPLCRADDQFIERPRDLRLVWHYLKRVGPLAVLRKVRSRLAEGTRNRKVAAVGSGIVRAAPEGSPWRTGDTVLFFAPNHPERRPRLACVDERFVLRLADLETMRTPDPPEDALPEELADFVGWSPFRAWKSTGKGSVAAWRNWRRSRQRSKR